MTPAPALLLKKNKVVEQGRRTRKSKLDITAAQLANKGAGGDMRATKLALEQVRKAEVFSNREFALNHFQSQAGLSLQPPPGLVLAIFQPRED